MKLNWNLFHSQPLNKLFGLNIFILTIFFYFLGSIIATKFLQCPQKQSDGNQLIHRRLSKTNAIDRGQEPESQAGKQPDDFGKRCLELRRWGK